MRGRDFTAQDGQGGPAVAIVNEAMARRYWPGGDALGKRIGLGEDFAQRAIVGIARDSKYASFGDVVEPLVFLPTVTARNIHVRTSRQPSQMIAEIERVARSIEASLPPYTGRAMRDAMAGSLGPARVVQVVLATAGLTALLLAAGGLYGLVCYTLERRLKEIGIRIALGANKRSVLQVVVGGVARLTVMGVLIGALLASAATRLMSGLLYGLSPIDSLTFSGVAALLLLVTLAAGYAALRQGLTINPVALLRQD